MVCHSISLFSLLGIESVYVISSILYFPFPSIFPNIYLEEVTFSMPLNDDMTFFKSFNVLLLDL